MPKPSQLGFYRPAHWTVAPSGFGVYSYRVYTLVAMQFLCMSLWDLFPSVVLASRRHTKYTFLSDTLLPEHNVDVKYTDN